MAAFEHGVEPEEEEFGVGFVAIFKHRLTILRLSHCPCIVYLILLVRVWLLLDAAHPPVETLFGQVFDCNCGQGRVGFVHADG